MKAQSPDVCCGDGGAGWAGPARGRARGWCCAHRCPPGTRAYGGPEIDVDDAACRKSAPWYRRSSAARHTGTRRRRTARREKTLITAAHSCPAVGAGMVFAPGEHADGRDGRWVTAVHLTLRLGSSARIREDDVAWRTRPDGWRPADPRRLTQIEPVKWLRLGSTAVRRRAVRSSAIRSVRPTTRRLQGGTSTSIA